MGKDIHEYDKQIESLMNHVRSSAISEPSKKLLLDFDRALLLVEGLGKARRIKLVGTMFLLARERFHGDLEHVSEDDIKNCVRDLEGEKLSPWTVAGYKISLKKFFKWMAYGDDVGHTDEVPENVRWLKVHVKKRNQPHVQASDILTEDEALKLIEVADHPRDRAFIAMIYELGARIGEMGGLNVGDVTRDKYSFLIDLTGKTGHRTPRIVLSDPYLTEWLSHHPNRDDMNAPLWVCPDGKGHHKRLMYGALRHLVQRLKQKAGITKRLYPHLFRHSRVTHLLMKHQLNETQAKVYFGWTPDSKMIGEYAHLMSRDVNDTILQIHGIKSMEEPAKADVKVCPRCQRINGQEARFCIHCSSILDPAGGFRKDQEQEKTDRLLNLIMADPEIQALILRKLTRTDVATLKELQ